MRHLIYRLENGFARSRRVVRGVFDWVPLTPLGVLVSAGAVYALFKSSEEVDLVLKVIGWAVLVLVALSSFLVLVCALWIQYRVAKSAAPSEAIRCETGRRTLTGFQFGALRYVPFVRISWTWSDPSVFVEHERKHGTRIEWTTFAKRSALEQVVRKIRVQGVFAFAKVIVRHRINENVLVLPHLGALGSLPRALSLSGGQEWSHPYGRAVGDRVDVRRYASGDPARFIHWKMYSRTRTLMLRTPENALSETWETYCYMIAGKRDEASAALSRAWLEELNRVGAEWSFAADGSPAPTRTLDEALYKIAQSSRYDHRQGSELEQFLRKSINTEAATLHLFIPPVTGAWAKQVINILRRRRLHLHVWIGIDQSSDHTARWWHKLVWLTLPSIRLERKKVHELAQLFSGLTSQVTIVERLTGRATSIKSRRPSASDVTFATSSGPLQQPKRAEA